ncbi:hypothetical protein BD560DRAFT_457920 [Blakeslea trispora]|nr:hypothetical protein BD560DRAFT_457920 [Blakeslea trispora]
MRSGKADLYWSKREAQYRVLQAEYDQKQLSAKIGSELAKELSQKVEELQGSSKNKKRKRDVDLGEHDDELDATEEDCGEEQEAMTRRYVLDFMEINSTNMKQLKVHRTKKRLTLQERLNLSCIDLVKEESLVSRLLSKNALLMIENWRKAIKNQDDFFVTTPAPCNSHEMVISDILTSLFLYDKDSTRRACKYPYMRTEIDFIVKFVSVLLENTFSASKNLHIDWDTLSVCSKEKTANYFKADRPDVVVICNNGLEVGCGQAKPPKKSRELINVDRARIAELNKRQVHLRLKEAKSSKQLRTFGILVTGKRSDSNRRNVLV